MRIIDFYCPYSIELLFDFFSKCHIKTNEKYTQEKKSKVFGIISQMLEDNVIFVGERKEGNFVRWEYSINETIDKIDKIWSKNTKFPDFYNMVWFGYQKWYIDALKRKGYGKEKILWIDFVKQNLGDLDKWIEENKPKE